MAQKIVDPKVLVQFLTAMGISRDDLVANESAERLHHTFAVDPSLVAGVDPRLCTELTKGFGSSARVDFRFDDYQRFRLDHRTKPSAIAAFLRESPAVDNIVVSIDKDIILNNLLTGGEVAQQRFLYLFADTLCRDLKRGIASFEEEVWSRGEEPLLLVTLDSNTELRGPWFAVLSSAFSSDPFRGNRSSVSRLKAARTERERLIGWDARWTCSLTPEHFIVSGTSNHPELKGLVHQQMVKLAILYMCDRARERPIPGDRKRILAEFRGEAHVAAIEIDETAPLPPVPEEVLTSVAEILDWCYAPNPPGESPAWVGDRLVFVQTRLAQHLQARAEGTRFIEFARAMPDVFAGVSWHWKAFIEGKVAGYTAEVRELESLVNSTVLDFSEQIRALVKSLSESMLAAVAVLVGSLIAAAFKAPFNEPLFRIGMLSYAGYVLVFPGLLGLLATHRSFTAVHNEFGYRQATFERTLYPEKVEEIVGQRVKDARRSFRRWFWAIAGVYILVVALAVAASFAIPKMIRSGEEPSQPTPSTAKTLGP